MASRALWYILQIEPDAHVLASIYTSIDSKTGNTVFDAQPVHGGKAQGDETIVDALKRELAEETTLQFNVHPRHLGTVAGLDKRHIAFQYDMYLARVADIDGKERVNFPGDEDGKSPPETNNRSGVIIYGTSDAITGLLKSINAYSVPHHSEQIVALVAIRADVLWDHVREAELRLRYSCESLTE